MEYTNDFGFCESCGREIRLMKNLKNGKIIRHCSDRYPFGCLPPIDKIYRLDEMTKTNILNA